MGAEWRKAVAVYKGKTYRAEDIKALCNMSESGAYCRIRDFNAGKINGKKLLRQIKPSAVCGGVVYKVADIMEIGNVSKDGARYRIREFNKGRLSAEYLLKDAKESKEKDAFDVESEEWTPEQRMLMETFYTVTRNDDKVYNKYY